MEVIGVIAFIAFLAWLGPKLSQRNDNRYVPRPSSYDDRDPRPVTEPQDAKQASPKSEKVFDADTGIAVQRSIRGRAYVIDGDSLVIKKTQVRIFGVDAPEMNHPYGNKAKWAMYALCKGQDIRADVVAEDAHGRTVAKCFLPDGRDLSAELVKQGLALDWPKFSGGHYRRFETTDARRKLWLADARQKGRMHVWKKFEESQKARTGKA